MRPTIALIFALLLALPTALAIGIGPSDTIIDFEPNSEVGLTNIVINNAGRDMPVTIYVDPHSDLAPFVTLPENTTFVIPQNGRASFTYRVKLPDHFDRPGFHDLQIGVVEGIATPGMIGTVTAATTRLRVRVPYPGKYLELNLIIPDVKEGEDVPITLSLTSRGTDPIATASAVATISSQGEKIADVSLGTVNSINPRETKTLTATWDAKTQKPGQYKADVAVHYDGNDDTISGRFNIGTERIDILRFTDAFTSGGIEEFDVHAKSSWNYPIDGVLGTIKVTQNGRSVAELVTPTTTFPPWQEQTLAGFWDLHGVEPGLYDGEVTVHYLNRTTQMTGTITVTAMPIEKPVESPVGLNTTLLLVGLVAILVIAVLVNIIIMLRKRR